MKTLGYLWTLLFTGILFTSSAQLYTYRNFNHRDGLHIVSVSASAQSEDGYIWLGTEGTPLVRFDGKEFREMRVKNQDSDHHIKSLQCKNDSVFFASQYKGFFAFAPKSKQYYNYGVRLEGKGDALALLVTDNAKYFVSETGIFLHKNGKTKQIKSFGNRFIKLYHHLINGENVLLFTSEGNFLVNGSSVKLLSDVLKRPASEIDRYKFGHVIRNKWVLCDPSGTKWMELSTTSKGIPVLQKHSLSDSVLARNERIISYDFSPLEQKIVAITNLGSVYKIVNNTLNIIPHNFNENVNEPADIMIDLNGDYWVCSQVSGLYKISLEPFTKIELHPLYESPNIMFPFMTMFNDVFISLRDGTTKVGHFNSTSFEEYPFMIKGATVVGNEYYLATNVGVKKFYRNNDGKSTFEDVYFEKQNINFILSDGDCLWVGVAGQGLFRIHLKAQDPQLVESANKNPVPQYIYSGQVADKSRRIYVGTNNGIFWCDRDNPKMNRLDTPQSFGYYSGCSAKDVYGTIWFTMEKGLIGITPEGKMRKIRGEDYFNTNLYYTLCADRLGNLIVGTNKGINILKVDKNGFVRGNSSYDASSGFMGYETHMRSQFQQDNSIFVGTVEGLFLINTDILDQIKAPIKPTIIAMRQYDPNTPDSRNSYQFKFRVNNPQSGKIFYQYRLLGSTDDSWVPVRGSQLNLFNLPSGNYRLEVKATHDNVNFSPVASYEIMIPLKFWKSSWMIFLVIAVIIGLNFLLVRYSRRVDSGSLIRTKDMEVHIRMAPLILLLGAIATTAAHIAGPYLSDELTLNLGPTLFISFCLTGLYFLSRSVIGTNREYYLNKLIIIGVVLVIFHLFYESWRSNLHPFYTIGVAITCMIVPFFLYGIRSMVYFTSFILFCAVSLLFIVENPIYPKPLLAIAYALIIILMIFSSFLRSNSLERLIFISGIINRGNIPAIAFNSEGKILYASENISNFINVTHDDLIDKDISTLNHFIPYEGNFKNVDVVKDFVEGKNYIVPLADELGTIRWIDWQYKEFSGDIKVILGQEVSEKMELENTYELLVQNAEDFIYRCDINGNFLFLNNVCYERLGYSKSELMGKDSMSIVPDDFQGEVRAFYADHFAQRKTSSYKEFPILKENGDIVWIGQHVTTIFAPGSNTFINGFIALARDITDFRRQQQLIKDQRDNITSSINYAQRIQFNLLPHERYFASGFSEHFIIYKPKDIVSGDFYWLATIEDTTILVLADCTGHGVPGSFMTLLGINLLNSIVNENRILDPGKILDELDKKLVDILPRNPNVNSLNDGMEITVCAINQNTDEMAFACAGSRFLIYTDDSFTMLKGDNKHIGDRPPQDFKYYSTHYTQLTSDDLLYLFTDGLQDQFGGKLDKKFTFRRVLTMLEKNAPLPLPDQRVNIEKRLSGWIGNSEQTDDITILSIKKKIV